MSDEFAKQVEAEQTLPTEPQGGRSVTLTITLHPDGSVEFNIPKNKVVAYGMLGMAQAQMDKLGLLSDFAHTKQGNGGGLDGLMRRMKGGR